MNQYGVVQIFRYRPNGQLCNIILFPTREEANEYAERIDIDDACWLWYVVDILERSQSEVSAGIDLFSEIR